jgi:hypothetical protein
MIPFVGPSYHLNTRKADVQRTVNLFPVMNEVAGGKTGSYLQSVPGLVEFSGPPSIYYTSWPYPPIVDDAMTAGLSSPVLGQLWIPPLEELNADLSTPRSGTLDTVLHTYTNWPADEINADLSTPQSGTLDVVLHSYTAQPEQLSVDLSTPQSGTLDLVLILYSNWPADQFGADLSIPLSGTLA